MQVNFNEVSNDFWLMLEAENLQEAATLTRFGLNGRQVDYKAVSVTDKGVFTAEVSFVKTKRDHTSQIVSGSRARKQ